MNLAQALKHAQNRLVFRRSRLAKGSTGNLNRLKLLISPLSPLSGPLSEVITHPTVKANFCKEFSIIFTTALCFVATITHAENPQKQTPPQPDMKDRADGQPADPKVIAGEIIAAFDYGDELSFEEAWQLLRLSTAPLAVKIETIRLGLAEEDSIEPVARHVAFLARAAAGLDPTGETTKALIEHCIQPVLDGGGRPHGSFRIACQLLQHLPIQHPATTAELLTKRMFETKEFMELGFLSETLVAHVPALEADEAKRLSMMLIERISSHAREGEFWKGDLLLGTLATRLPPADVRILIDEIGERMRIEKNQHRLLQLGNAQLALALGLAPEESRGLIAELMKQGPKVMESAEIDTLIMVIPLLESASISAIAPIFLAHLDAPRSHSLRKILARRMEPLSTKLRPEDLRSLVAPLIEQIKNDPASSLESIATLGPFASCLEPQERHSLTSFLLTQLKMEEDSMLEDASIALASLAGALSATHASEIADSVVDLLTDENEGGEQYLNEILEALVQNLGPPAIRRLATGFVNAKGGDDESLDSLAALALKLESADLEVATSGMVKRILEVAGDDKKGKESRLRGLRQTLEPLASKLIAEGARPLVVLLSGRMQTEGESEILAELGRVVGVLAAPLERSDLKTATSALASRIKIEHQGDVLERLTKALWILGPRTDRAQARMIADALIERMQVERDGKELALLGRALASLLGKLEASDFDTGFRMLVEALKKERDGAALGDLGRCVGEFAPVVSKEELAEVADILTARMGMVRYGRMAEYSWVDYRWEEGPGSEKRNLEEALRILEAASAQSLVNLLKAPLLAQDYIVEITLKALENRLDETFSNVGAFVRWATSDDEALALGLDLEGIGAAPSFEEPEGAVLPLLEGVKIEPLGSLEVRGAVWSFCVDKNLVYLPAGAAGLQIVDIADPAAPKLLGKAKAGPYAIDCCVAGDHAYVITGPAGMPESYLRVVNVSDVTDPRVVGSLPMRDYPARVAVRGRHVFIADRTEGMRVIDVSDPTAPREVGALEVPSVIVDVALEGDLAFLADQEVGLRVVDISDPTEPKELAVMNTKGPGLAVAAQGKRVYLATGESGLVVIDASDPSQPKIVATIPVQVCVTVAVREGLGVVGAGGLGAKALDINDPEAPTELGLEMSALGVGVCLREDLLLVTDVEPGGAPYGSEDRTILRVFKIAN